ncbi:hypothetical protein M5D96_004973 [Drosophila gunungcola]|uniref:Gustatory receptor n=1 Tax=Drosophila gunungcola TaxID=103775 RepID=A0A9Q0BTS5_9MUSC|nr:hypothetical protein M5D96_004973 [Drosophila gunungcola]
MRSLELITRRFLAAILWTMGLVPLPAISQLRWLFLSLASRCCWIVYLVYLLKVGFSFSSVAIESVGNVVGTMLFMGNSVLGLLILLESVLKEKTHSQLENLRFQSQLQLQRLGIFGRRRQAGYLLPLIGVQLTCDLVRVFINSRETISPVFTISLPLMWLLRFRYVQLVQHVMDLNQRSLQLRRSLLSLASGNDLWQPYGLHECRQLQTLRTTYERIFECYENFSDCYGWGILGLHLLSSFQFVTSAYYMLMWLYDGQNLQPLIFNGATGIDFGTPIATLFWLGDSGAENTLSHAFFVVVNFHLGFRVEQDQMEEVVICETSDPWLAFTVLAMILPILGVEYLVYSNASENAYRILIYHLKTSPSHVALQMQFISFILEVMKVNIRVRQAKQQLQLLARELSSRWPQCKQRPEYFDQQSYRIKDLKRRYNEIYNLFDRINDFFGASLLIIIIVFFALFVCNSYWLFVDVRTNPLRIYVILLNLGFIFNVALQMSTACWHCQQSDNLGRQIGCLISKLVKPQGSKRYNDLVSEFSLQTLHQRFVVTAKDFFSLNLRLLSSMFAAVVTYLVILIQFMFAERSSRG